MRHRFSKTTDQLGFFAAKSEKGKKQIHLLGLLKNLRRANLLAVLADLCKFQHGKSSAKGQLNSERIYQVIVSLKMITKN